MPMDRSFSFLKGFEASTSATVRRHGPIQRAAIPISANALTATMRRLSRDPILDILEIERERLEIDTEIGLTHRYLRT